MKTIKRCLIILGILLSGCTIVTIVGTIVAPSAYADMQDYTKGFNLGWSNGWKTVKGDYFYPPYPPYPPYPSYGRDTFTHGYNDGLRAGMAAARKTEY